MSVPDQVTRLNERVKLTIALSKIHGVGVFAIRDIAKGQKLYADNMPEVYNLRYSSFGKLFKEVSALLLSRWPQIVNGSNFIYPDCRLLAYMNHSDDPNYEAETDTLLRDVVMGDEITEDYRRIPGSELVYDWLKK